MIKYAKENFLISFVGKVSFARNTFRIPLINQSIGKLFINYKCLLDYKSTRTQGS